MRFYLTKIIIVFFIFFQTASFSQSFTNINVNGNSRISKDTIILFSQIPKNNVLNENSINLILKKLYETSYFSDVNVSLNNELLSITVVENPIIKTVLLNGIKTKKLSSLINESIKLKDRSSFNINLIKADKNIILNILKANGYYFSNIVFSVRNLNDNKVDLIYDIELGNKSRISKITFVGNKFFKDSRLKNIILTEVYKPWKFVTSKKFLNEDLINFDKKLLTNYYKNNGFFNVKVESTFANYMGNDNFELIYSINSGKKFYFDNLSINLPIDFNKSHFIKLNSKFDKLNGKPYSINSIKGILDIIDQISLMQGYEFLESNVSEKINEDKINLTFNILESEKFYIERINVFGNNVTRENVIRNNLIVDEGDAFNELLHAKSINNLKSLNFFRDVSSSVSNGTSQKTKIIDITVIEKPTGEISAGAGIGTTGGTFAFSVTENNFLGRGIKFGSNLELSSEAVRGLFSMSNPNYRGTDRSVNFTLESSVTDRLDNFGYKSTKSGFAIGGGFEYYEDLFLNGGFSTYLESIETDSTASNNMKKQKGEYFDTYFNYTLDLDKRNQKFQTSRGFRSVYTQNIPIVSENNTVKNIYRYKYFTSLFDNNLSTFGFYTATSNSITGDNVKLSERLFLPSSQLRGFESGKVGPKDGTDFIGGNYVMSLNIASTLPQILPSYQNIDFSIFYDVANIWGIDYDSTIDNSSKIRSSVGISMDIFTFIGPLSLSLAETITKDVNDITETFRFNLGTTF